MDINDSINNLKIKLFDINSIYPKCNSKLTSILGLKCDSRSGYITYNIINDSDLYKNKDQSNIISEYNNINNSITFDNKQSIYNKCINDFKLYKIDIINNIYKIISQQPNHIIRQCDIKKDIQNLSPLINHNDYFIYNFTQLMVNSNMLTTFTEGNKRYYRIGEQIEYIEPNIIEKNNYASKYEAIVAQYLIDKNIYFTTQKTFPKCKNKRCLPFDFYINIYDMDILIEYNGIQHYKSINHFGGDTSFEQRQINDNIKLNYTIDNEIPFIIIPYNISNKEDIYKYLNLEIDKYFKQ